MRRVLDTSLWIGNAGDARDLRRLLSHDIAALVDLALEEPAATVTRDLVYVRFPLVDGADNPPWLLSAAVALTARLLREGVPTLVACGAGMSRSPAVVAAARAVCQGRSAHECLREVLERGPGDVAPGLWRDVERVVASMLGSDGVFPAGASS